LFQVQILHITGKKKATRDEKGGEDPETKTTGVKSAERNNLGAVEKKSQKKERGHAAPFVGGTQKESRKSHLSW